jgi:hypothetical protein
VDGGSGEAVGQAQSQVPEDGRGRLHEIDEVKALIHRRGGLLLAGDEQSLRQLPTGNWIGGTIPYFMTREGGIVDRRRIFVNELPEGLRCHAIRRYGEDEIARVYSDLPPRTFGVMIVPASSRAHLRYALQAPTFPQFAKRPIIGWVSGVHLSEMATRSAKVFDGTSAGMLDQHAIVMQVALPSGKLAQLGLVNMFQAGDGPTISFPASGFSATEVEIGGRRRNFAQFIHENDMDMRLPMVANYCGIGINVSFQSLDRAKGEVRFYAPVFTNVPYRHARPVPDFSSAFVDRLPHRADDGIAFSCNCILNFLHSNLEGRRSGTIAGPVTFGEIAYQLLNQTMAYLRIADASPR